MDNKSNAKFDIRDTIESPTSRFKDYEFTVEEVAALTGATKYAIRHRFARWIAFHRKEDEKWQKRRLSFDQVLQTSHMYTKSFIIKHISFDNAFGFEPNCCYLHKKVKAKLFTGCGDLLNATSNQKYQ